MGDFNQEEWERGWAVQTILKGTMVLAGSPGSIQSRLYTASVIFYPLTISMQEFNDMWAYVIERLERYTDKKRGIVNCSYTEAKNIVSDVFTCLRYILDYNSRFDMVSQLEVSQ
jgi:hypothetical protein